MEKNPSSTPPATAYEYPGYPPEQQQQQQYVVPQYGVPPPQQQQQPYGYGAPQYVPQQQAQYVPQQQAQYVPQQQVNVMQQLPAGAGAAAGGTAVVMDGVDVHLANNCMHCLCACFCSTCYVGGCCHCVFRGTHVNRCGALTMIIAMSIGFSLSLFSLVVGILQIFGGPNTAEDGVIFSYVGDKLFLLAFYSIVLVVGIMALKRVRNNTGGGPIQLIRIDAIVLIVQGTSGLVTMVLCTIAYIIFVSASLYHVGAGVSLVLESVNAIVTACMYFYWAIFYYRRLGLVQDSNTYEVSRTAIENLSPHTAYTVVATENGLMLSP